MNKVKKIKKEELMAVVIDYQEKLLPAMEEWEVLEETAVKALKGLDVLKVPIIVTQQYSKGLGTTTMKIRQAMSSFSPVEKTTFSAMKAEEFCDRLKASGKKQLLIMGIETHICILQTVLDALEQGYEVFVMVDGCRSRQEDYRNHACRRMEQAGAVLTNYEMVLYELLGGAKAEGFKEIAAIVK